MMTKRLRLQTQGRKYITLSLLDRMNCAENGIRPSTIHSYLPCRNLLLLRICQNLLWIKLTRFTNPIQSWMILDLHLRISLFPTTFFFPLVQHIQWSIQLSIKHSWYVSFPLPFSFISNQIEGFHNIYRTTGRQLYNRTKSNTNQK